MREKYVGFAPSGLHLQVQGFPGCTELARCTSRATSAIDVADCGRLLELNQALIRSAYQDGIVEQSCFGLYHLIWAGYTNKEQESPKCLKPIANFLIQRYMTEHMGANKTLVESHQRAQADGERMAFPILIILKVKINSCPKRGVA
jgi:hypothetical protein